MKNKLVYDTRVGHRELSFSVQTRLEAAAWPIRTIRPTGLAPAAPCLHNLRGCPNCMADQCLTKRPYGPGHTFAVGKDRREGVNNPVAISF